jgi:CcmD family protein
MGRPNGLLSLQPGGRIGEVSSLAFLAAVNLVIWAGLFFYLWRLDRRLSDGDLSEKGREP